ncbi:hypothetical protein AURDEDRAFT_116609 [Auricularia subglabra TFB-10046 SS5]|nr:hypothetical protein AURDEDRAFT_116609 [Auricularia subglabra TFB-10046 SS5]
MRATSSALGSVEQSQSEGAVSPRCSNRTPPSHPRSVLCRKSAGPSLLSATVPWYGPGRAHRVSTNVRTSCSTRPRHSHWTAGPLRKVTGPGGKRAPFSRPYGVPTSILFAIVAPILRLDHLGHRTNGTIDRRRMLFHNGPVETASHARARVLGAGIGFVCEF